jgi:ubiquinone/menaquinone biosynthesis C-methylase UbiE
MQSFSNLLNTIDSFVCSQKHADAIALIDVELGNFPVQSVELLAYAYDIVMAMPDKSRYAQYQSRYIDFGIKPGDKVLDMGSGHIPFPLATHLADIALTDDTVGRAGNAFKHVDGKPVYECSMENTPFKDSEFDFVYCSHVLEHVVEPETACKELMRIAKRGYIECPRLEQDTFFNSAEISNHLWGVDNFNNTLVFTEYDAKARKGLATPLFAAIYSAPQNITEKAIAALYIVKAGKFNTMFLWEKSFLFEVRRLSLGALQPYKENLVSTEDVLNNKRNVSRKIWRQWNALRNKLARKIEPSSLL